MGWNGLDKKGRSVSRITLLWRCLLELTWRIRRLHDWINVWHNWMLVQASITKTFEKFKKSSNFRKLSAQRTENP
jgi:hypothetical protein